jgi:hypothetical protein
VDIEDLPRIRLSPVPDAPLLVVRGGVLEPDLTRADAIRFLRRYPLWGRYGISAYFAADDEEIDVLCETRLERFETVAVFLLSALGAAGIEVVPTFRRPHVTLAHADLEALVDGLRSCEPRIVNNRYHRGPGDGRP